MDVPLPSLTANDSESEDEDTLLGDDENWNEVFSTINITAEQKAQMERRKAQLAAIREIANGSSDDEGGSDSSDLETRAKRRAMASSEPGVPFFDGSDSDEYDEPMVTPSAMVSGRVIGPDEDDEN